MEEIRTFDKLNKEEVSIQKLKVRHFLNIILKSLTKHFLAWTSPLLLFLSLFEESNTATCVANYFLGQQGSEEEEMFVSKSHG